MRNESWLYAGTADTNSILSRVVRSAQTCSRFSCCISCMAFVEWWTDVRLEARKFPDPGYGPYTGPPHRARGDRHQARRDDRPALGVRRRDDVHDRPATDGCGATAGRSPFALRRSAVRAVRRERELRAA